MRGDGGDLDNYNERFIQNLGSKKEVKKDVGKIRYNGNVSSY